MLTDFGTANDLVFAFAGKPNWRGTADLTASKAEVKYHHNSKTLSLRGLVQPVATVARPSRGHCQATLVTCLVDVHPPAASADLGRVARTFPVAVALLREVLLCRGGVATVTFLVVENDNIKVLAEKIFTFEYSTPA